MHNSPLFQAFFDNPDGLCGQHDPSLPVAAIQSLETRLHIITLGSVLDKKINSKRWADLIKLEGHWLLDSSQVAYKSSHQVLQALQEEKIRSPQHIARVWWQICRGVQGRFNGSFRALLQANSDDALSVQNYLRKSRTTFPVLSAPITSAHWLDMVHRRGEVQLQRWDKLRVTLPARQRKTALLFGLDDADLHPALALALHAWPSACQHVDEISCGLEHCPRR